MPVEPRPAATVVLLRPAPGSSPGSLEVLLTHRPATMAFAADMHVFPGGRVDAGDRDPGLASRSVIDGEAASDALGGDLPAETALAAYVAAIRECFEEVGVLLADVGRAGRSGADLAAARERLLAGATPFAVVAEDLDLRLRTDRLVPLSRWVTPPNLPRRFDARFFAALLPDGAAASLVGDEVAAHAWHTPRAALDAMASGRIGMWIPTSATLQQLEHGRSIEEIRERAAPGRLGAVVVEAVDGADDVVRISMPAGGGVAGQSINAYLVGRSACVLIDPGDPTGSGIQAAIEAAAARGGRIVAVALTHLDPDHAAGAETVAEQCGVPVFASPVRAADVPYVVAPLVDGDRVPVGDVPLRVVATPGPTPDHLAFVVGEGRAVISGDLDGVRGARSIPGSTDDAAWARSVAVLRSVAPGARWLGGH
ncbi:MAG: MBL fold metallo-hydrolase [Candidatus Limnocylindrales bacterium]